MPVAVAYHLDTAVAPQPAITSLDVAAPVVALDAETQLVHDLVALADDPAADPVTVQVAHRGGQLEVTLRRTGLDLELPVIEPVARAHHTVIVSAYATDGIVRLALLFPARGRRR